MSSNRSIRIEGTGYRSLSDQLNALEASRRKARMTAIVAFYARVSSGKQAQADTIASQIAALETRIHTEGNTLTDAFRFMDNGYSGSNLPSCFRAMTRSGSRR